MFPGLQEADYRVGQIGTRTGLTARQLRDWERRGLVTTRRGSRKQRLYGEDDLARLVQAKLLRDAGLGLSDIKVVLKILHGTALGTDSEGVARSRGFLAGSARYSKWPSSCLRRSGFVLRTTPEGAHLPSDDGSSVAVAATRDARAHRAPDRALRPPDQVPR